MSVCVCQEAPAVFKNKQTNDRTNKQTCIHLPKTHTDAAAPPQPMPALPVADEGPIESAEIQVGGVFILFDLYACVCVRACPFKACMRAYMTTPPKKTTCATKNSTAQKVPNDAVGLLLGRGGEGMRLFIRETGVHSLDLQRAADRGRAFQVSGWDMDKEERGMCVCVVFLAGIGLLCV